MLWTRIRSFKWGDISRSSKSSTEEFNKEENIKSEEIRPEFDKKYKSVIKIPHLYSTEYLEQLNWIDANTKGLVTMKVTQGWLYIGFEDADDALVFKIKYGV